jgi:hypothetical protein
VNITIFSICDKTTNILVGRGVKTRMNANVRADNANIAEATVVQLPVVGY